MNNHSVVAADTFISLVSLSRMFHVECATLNVIAMFRDSPSNDRPPNPQQKGLSFTRYKMQHAVMNKVSFSPTSHMEFSLKIYRPSMTLTASASSGWS